MAITLEIIGNGDNRCYDDIKGIVHYFISSEPIEIGDLHCKFEFRDQTEYDNVIEDLKNSLFYSSEEEYIYYKCDKQGTIHFGDAIAITKNDSIFSFDAIAESALLAIENGENVFVTGKAGTGKTTLLKEIIKRNNTSKNKNIAILAPTGVAAENAGGMTLHHFLRLPRKPYLPEHKVRPSLFNLASSMEEVVCSLDMIIIDEISMVRCDLLDAMDAILRHYRNSRKPFGGIQLVMFGDLYQLSPVVKDEDWVEMKPYYNYIYFFCSKVFDKLKYKIIELTKIYRQEDSNFKGLLNRVRVADVSLADLELLKSRYDPDYAPSVYDNVVTLMTHIYQTDNKNCEMFSNLKGDVHIYNAYTDNWWGERFPTEKKLELKVGSRVMMLRNTDNFKNGTLGRIEYLYSDSVIVKKDNGESVEVNKMTWEQLEYYVDKETKTIYTQVSGTFTQLPLKLAWAVSIHKSQGLTFDEVAIDASKSFTYGQVYVALSRCRTLEGIHLIKQIPYQKIKADEVVTEYLKCIDENGYVKLPRKFKPIKFEKNALILYVSSSRFTKLKNHEKKVYTRSIDNENKELLFLHKNNKICVHSTFSKLKKNWSYLDTNDGNCPFVQRQYNKVIFRCSDMNEQLDAEINGHTEIYLNKENRWSFKFTISNITNIRKIN